MEKRKCVFIVDDNELYSMMLDYILSQESKYQFMSFKSGEECIKSLYLKPEVIILDYGLPGMNGYDTLLEIKKLHPQTHVIMLSNSTDPELAAKLLRAGADDYLLKESLGERLIIEKIEAILLRDEMEKETHTEIRKNFFMSNIFYVILIIIVLSVGLVYLKEH